MKYKIDLNSDLGESYGAFKIGQDEKIIPLITSANVACGWHAGDPCVIDNTIKTASVSGIKVGAHPGFPDLVGFGRRDMKVTPREMKLYIEYQLGAISVFCKTYGVSLQHIKPHGAMYNMAVKDKLLADAVCEAAVSFSEDLILLAPKASEMYESAVKKGLNFKNEVFADRAYEDDGSLVPRSKDGSMITDENEAVERVIRMIKDGKVRTISGKDINITADSVCVHGDNSHAFVFINRLREAFSLNGITIGPLS